MKKFRLTLVIALIAIGTIACQTENKNETEEIELEPVLKLDEVEVDWLSLFDGETTYGWSNYGSDLIGPAWQVQDSMLYLNTTRGEDGKRLFEGGDIVTNAEFEDFHLKLEWKISEKGNSGIMFYVQEDKSKYPYPWSTGPEMQILDNGGHSDGQIESHRTGDLYDLVKSSSEPVKPVGEWNQVEIISQNEQLTFILNGVTIVETSLWDESWRQLIANSKFKDMPDFGTFKKGKISLQDHGDDVWFRNIQIKRLN
jgi:hypothetical protein